MAFTTWQALYESMLDDMAAGTWRHEEYRIAGRSMRYRSFEEFKAALEYVRIRAGEEAGIYSARVYAKQGGRGS